jgi:signal transduction histidine kinase
LPFFEDIGSSFEVEKARGTGWQGPISMKDRVRLTYGDFKICQRPGAGAKVERPERIGLAAE